VRGMLLVWPPNTGSAKLMYLRGGCVGRRMLTSEAVSGERSPRKAADVRVPASGVTCMNVLTPPCGRYPYAAAVRSRGSARRRRALAIGVRLRR
jgi:hypothetical protein